MDRTTPNNLILLAWLACIAPHLLGTAAEQYADDTVSTNTSAPRDTQKALLLTPANEWRPINIVAIVAVSIAFALMPLGLCFLVSVSRDSVRESANETSVSPTSRTRLSLANTVRCPLCRRRCDRTPVKHTEAGLPDTESSIHNSETCGICIEDVERMGVFACGHVRAS